VSEFDVAARSAHLLRRGGRRDLDGQVERLKYAVRGDDGRVKNVVLVGDVAYGLEEKLRELYEGDERADGEHGVSGRVLHHAVAAVPDDERDADRADQVNEREEDGVVEDRLDVRAPVLVVDLVELPKRLRLAVENLHGLRARQVLLQEGVDARQPRADEVVAASRVPSEP